MALDVAQQAFEVPAPSIKGKGLIRLTIEPERVKQLAEKGSRSALYELFYNVCGEVPPVPFIGYHEGNPTFPDYWGGLRHAHAIFRGVKRPMNDDGVDRDVFIYIVAPQYVYKFIADTVCLAKREPAPAGAVFAVYVKFDDEENEVGRIVNWEWVIADPQEPRFPEKYNQRYDTKVWTNG